MQPIRIVRRGRIRDVDGGFPELVPLPNGCFQGYTRGSLLSDRCESFGLALSLLELQLDALKCFPREVDRRGEPFAGSARSGDERAAAAAPHGFRSR